MSGSVGSAWPSENLLFNAASGGATAEVARNQLLNQQTQQTIGSNEMEMMGRAAATLMDPTLYPTPEARAAAYPVRLAALQAQGFAKNAPSTYPGDTTMAALARMGTPSQTQAEWAQNLAANKAYSNANTPPTTPAAGGGGVAAPGPGGLPGQGGPIEPFATRLQGAEGNPGSVNAAGYSGQYQFGTSRLADLGMYKPAAGENLGANQWRGTLDIPGFPDVKTQADFLASPAAQRAALDVHVRNIDTAIAQTPGADQYDANGLRAVAHLGGPEGMRKFVASNGQYDPADANGTHLSDYYRRFSAPGSSGGTAVANTARPPLIRGDSLASTGGLGGSGAVGAPPRDVLSTVSGEARAGVYRGQPVVLSTGASNDPGDLASVEQQVQEARGGGASSVTVLGVGPGVETKAPGTNAALQAIAARNGAQFVPLPTGAGMMSPDGVHPTAQGYATLKTAVAPPAAAPGGGGTPAPYRVAGAMQPPPGTPTAPGQGAPAPGQPAPPAPGQAAPGGGPAPPQLAQLNENGMTPIQQRQIDAMAANPQTSLKERMAAQQRFVNQNIQLAQKAFSDYIAQQQLAVSQGQLTNEQAKTNLDYWKANHPELAPNARENTIAYRTMQELAPIVRGDNGAVATQEQKDRYNEATTTYLDYKSHEHPITRELLQVPSRPLPPGFPEPSGGSGVRTLTQGMSTAQQEAERELGKNFATTDLKSYAAANASLGMLTNANNAAEVMNSTPGGFEAPGAGANARLEIAKNLNQVAGLMGSGPIFDPSKISAWEALNKQTKLMGMQVVNNYFGGSREAASIINGATGAVPNSENTYLGFRLVSSGIEQDLLRQRELYEFKSQRLAAGQPLAAAEVEFNKTHPVENYTARAIANAVPEDMAAFLMAHPDTVQHFDQRFGPGIGEFILKGGRTQMGAPGRPSNG